MRSPKHCIRTGAADVSAGLQKGNVLFLCVFATHAQAMRNRLDAHRVAIGAILDAVVHPF
ncbi:hypothetical protein LK996_15560 [Lysobacter sp. A6]|uniref:Uncharacterized protein n=1 Tax=Noviluteimonas lactosilytica TaxID=2888523 RepID=A0ABS8JLJ7_9GAMM|nr:hypothetical protein [Lysobacter lactosilyticus]MCC8364488.1 hypothetical protein [Lysobacter lactosilyticus]